MRIPCPYCGERDAREFSYLGDANVVRPAADDAAAFHEYVHLRDNKAGTHREFGYHASGCRTWLVVTRDTRTHRIEGAELAR
ncbi:MAG: sarcosine oxidase subunit delta [Alphaproteobacteria bacterium]|nr:sarcosine oxidase subunit delta [Alphaproteobacteria bacterium]